MQKYFRWHSLVRIINLQRCNLALKFNNSVKKVQNITVRDALNKAMEHEMELDQRVFIFGEEVGQYDGAYKVTRGLYSKFGPKRVIDSPITEMSIAGLCVGSSLHGLRPICEFMTWNFALQAIDQIINSSAKIRYMSNGQITSPIVFRGPNGYSSGTAAQHSQNFASVYMACPGLKVVSPYSAHDSYGLLRAAIQDPDPVIFLEHELGYGLSFENVALEVQPIGKAKIEKEGHNVTLVSYSLEVKACLEASKILENDGSNISVEVINMRTLRPLDIESIKRSICKTKHLVVVDASWPQCSVASEIISRICESEELYMLDGPPCKVTLADVPMPYSEPLEKLAIPTVENIIRSIKHSLHIN